LFFGVFEFPPGRVIFEFCALMRSSKW
jgi:hypothetical protein